MATTYRVEICTEENESGEAIAWTLAARQPLPGEGRKMDYGAAEGLTAEDAENTRSMLAKGAQVRVVAEPQGDETAHGMTFGDWLEAAGRSDSASEYDLRAAWRAGENPSEYAV